MEGFRFACVPGCTDCCNVPGYVYLSDDDLKRAAEFLAMTPEAFETRYVYRTRHRLRFRKPPYSQCHFLEKDGCRIHPAKPTQCRLYPFWPEYVEDREAWTQVSNDCPGIGTGPLIQIGDALAVAQQMREAYPAMYCRRTDRQAAVTNQP